MNQISVSACTTILTWDLSHVGVLSLLRSLEHLAEVTYRCKRFQKKCFKQKPNLPSYSLFLELMSCLLLSHSSTFLFYIPLRSKVYIASSLRFSRYWVELGRRGGTSHSPAAGTPCTGCWGQSSFASDRYAAVCKGKKVVKC